MKGFVVLCVCGLKYGSRGLNTNIIQAAEWVSAESGTVAYTLWTINSETEHDRADLKM